MARTPPPFWLAASGRWAGIGRARALRVALALFVLIAAALTALAQPPATGDAAATAGEAGDVALYEGVIGALKAGGAYYPATADALRAGSYPLRPFVTFRLPVHAVVQAVLPPLMTLALLYALAIAVAVAWWRRLAPVLPRPPARITVAILIAGGMAAFVQSDLIAFHEIWSAQLVALALALWRPGRWMVPAALALVAMLVRETAALFPLVMLAAAWAAGDRREAAGWALALGGFALALVAHAWGVAQVVNPLDPASPGWSGLMGPGFFVRALAQSTALAALPMLVAAPLIALALFGWSVWRDPVAPRALALFVGYGTAIALFARPDTFYWALMAAPVVLVGLVFVPDGLRDLYVALLDKPRVRVQRITQ
ncbi:hypothetical protein [Sphingomonas sp. RS2018]